jgi:hypothetical protein
MRSFKALLVWQKAHRFALDVYGAKRDFPSKERFGLTSQLRRSAVSIASNIAEGCGRVGGRDLARFLSGPLRVQWQGPDKTVLGQAEITLARVNQKLDFVVSVR